MCIYRDTRWTVSCGYETIPLIDIYELEAEKAGVGILIPTCGHREHQEAQLSPQKRRLVAYGLIGFKGPKASETPEHQFFEEKKMDCFRWKGGLQCPSPTFLFFLGAHRSCDATLLSARSSQTLFYWPSTLASSENYRSAQK